MPDYAAQVPVARPLGDRRLHPRAAAQPARRRSPTCRESRARRGSEARRERRCADAHSRCSPDHMLYRSQRGAARRRRARPLLVAAPAGSSIPISSSASYLVAYLFCAGIALGLPRAWHDLNHLDRRRAGASSSGAAATATRTLPLLLCSSCRCSLGLAHLYEWATPDVVAHDAHLQHKHAYLNVPFFLVRAAIYFAVWLVRGALPRCWSLEQDDSGDPRVGAPAAAPRSRLASCSTA